MSSSINGQPTDQPIGSPRVDEIDSKPDEADEIEEDGGDEEADEDEGEEEDEDLDFNPFLKGTPSPEASSSLSSEVEVLDGHSSKSPADEVQNFPFGDSEHGEEVVMQCNTEKFDCVSQLERGNIETEESGFSKPATDSDDEDAIWKRTRARYSLASFTLDELETFLQETDDEDDLPNVDDEEEYRKFLAAVLMGGDADGQSAQGIENGEDEDEDNDADFEIELEELLESDGDESKREEQKRDYERSLRRPETRQNKRQKASDQYKKKLLEQSKRPLRPLLPIFPNAAVAPFPTVDGKSLMPETAPSYPSSAAEYLTSGFSPQQTGQLHCLIHEHVQLLIQVFSLCILDPSKQQVASQVQGLIFELLRKRDEGIASRNVPYPSICFHPSYMSASVTDEVSSFNPECPESSSTSNMQMPVSRSSLPTESNNDNVSQNGSSSWLPSTSNPVMSILDVAPLGLVGKYMDDVFSAVGEYRKRHLHSSSDTWNEKEPLFLLPNFPLLPEANSESSKGNTMPTISTVPCKAGQPPPKKTLAASIVENAKKQSIAFVPKEISKLIQRFQTLFNPALFPHKPPPAAVANRVLFTDAEDELLALGMMEFNTDWKAIQQRFLPCKATHQIFVRQKNRCSSKALENPIKAVRRMKTSPLTADEVECIQEGLRLFKHDWMLIWRYVVPHRDPSLLHRQWRTAIGIQKSYKSDAAKREKRRIYEYNRRRFKTADLANWQQDNQFDTAGGENNSGDDYIDNGNDTYVHQAFLADWRPDAKNLRGASLPREQSQINNMHGLPYARYCPYPNALSQFSNARTFPYSTNQVPCTSLNAVKSHNLWQNPTLVKLAPDLPPVNLPPTVRVISQAAFRNSSCGVPGKLASPGVCTSGSGKENTGFQLQHKKSRTTSLANTKGDKSNQMADPRIQLEEEDSAGGAEDRGTYSDLQMHPLLFQASENGQPSYYPLSRSTATSSSFTFFPANQPQLNLSLLHNPYQANQLVDCSNTSSKIKEPASASHGIDFHPLLQRTDEENSNLAAPFPSRPQHVSARGKSQSSGPVEKANDLDLEIHLSSSSTKQKSKGHEDVSATNRPMLTIEKNKSSSHSESFPIDESGNEDHRCSVDDKGDGSQPEIVMEQEELSDSDEDSEERVEFECEEMADSDGEEGLDCEATAEVQNKDSPSFATEDIMDCADHTGEQIGRMKPALNPGNVDPMNSSPLLKLGLTSLAKDGSSNSWLTLDSQAPVDPLSSEAKYEECAVGVSPVAKNFAAGHSNRISKKITPNATKRVATGDMARQLSLGPLSVSALNKPRKRICRSNMGSNPGVKTENSRYDQVEPG